MSRSITIYLLKRNKMFWLCVSAILAVIALAIIGPFLTPYKPNQVLPVRSQPPSWEHPFGVDNMGYDVFSATVYGLRVSLSVGLIAALIATIVGVGLGIIAGYVGGVTDSVLDGLTILLLMLPPAFLLVILGTFYILGAPVTGPFKDLYAIVLLGVMTGLLSWHWTARATRSIASALKVSDFVAVSKLSGNSTLKIIFKDLLPNMASYVLLVFVIQLANALGTIVTLEFLGIKASDWSLFARVQQWLQMGALVSGVWWAWLLPGIVIVVLITSLYLLVNSLEEIFNPRARGE